MPPPTRAWLAQQKSQQRQTAKTKRSFDETEQKRKPVFGRGPTGLREALKEPEVVSGPGPKPNSGPLALATTPEWYVYWALLRLGKRPGIDFAYRGETSYASLSTRTQLDFTMTDGSGIAIEVQGTYWHYQQGADKLIADTVRRSQLAGSWTVIFIDEDDVVGDPTGQAAIYYVSEALKGHDHSWRYRQFLRNPAKPPTTGG